MKLNSEFSFSFPAQEGTTIDMHLDQGLFLVFTPGRIYDQVEDRLSMARDFFIQLPDQKVPVLVEFDVNDDLVVLLGDGMNQYVNNRRSNDNFQLRAVPHSLSVQPNQQPRVWYGRMVLPPPTAVHPDHGISFGEIRQAMIEENSLSEAVPETSLSHLGCSGGHGAARQLEETSCESDSLFCWHRCMNLEQFDVSESICASQNLTLWCINPRGQLWDETHGDFYPGCIDPLTAVVATPFPEIDDYPRDVSVCSNESFAAFVDARQVSGGYEHSASIADNTAAFLWSVIQVSDVDGSNVALREDAGQSVIKGEVVVNSLFSWISVGLRGDEDFAMTGAHVLMAMNGGNYTPSLGVDMSMDPTYDEHVLGDSTPFRTWNTPVPSDDMADPSVNIDEDGCFAALSFTTGSFAGKALNVSGVDRMIWAANGKDSFMQYHGRDTRGEFHVQWSDGTLTVPVVEDAEEEGGHDDADSSSGAGSLVSAPHLAVVFTTLMNALFVCKLF
jgi:hypothetical protein